MIGLTFAFAFLLYGASPKAAHSLFASFMGLLLIMVVGGLVIFAFLAFTRTETSATSGLRVIDPVAFQQAPFFGRTADAVPVAPVIKEKSLMSRVAELDWYQFEKLTELVYRKLGYFVRREGGAKADGGIDLLLELNGTRTAVQCKHWKGWNVGVKIVREFIGAMTVARVTRGILICTKGFTQEARSLANQQGIEIVDARGLEQLLKRADADSDPKFRVLFESKEKRCPKCEREMVIRTATKGRDVGSKFWGCSGYPQGCRYTMAV